MSPYSFIEGIFRVRRKMYPRFTIYSFPHIIVAFNNNDWMDGPRCSSLPSVILRYSVGKEGKARRYTWGNEVKTKARIKFAVLRYNTENRTTRSCLFSRERVQLLNITKAALHRCIIRIITDEIVAGIDIFISICNRIIYKYSM